MPADALESLRDQALDMRVLRWSDGPKGATVTFDLHADDVAKNGGVNPFKGREGKRFKVLLWEVADDETVQPAAPAPAPSPARSEQAKAAYRAAAPMTKAATKAALLCKDRQFQQWLAGRVRDAHPFPAGISEETRTTFRLRQALGVASRSEIATDEDACRKFLAMETEYLIATKQMASPR